MYYLQSRYYDPELGRFLNADALVSTGQGILGNNMFAYCGNNPVNMIDSAGNIPWHIILGALIGGGTTAFITLINGGSVEEVLIDAALGAGLGALVTIYPQLALILTSYELTETFFECLYQGLSPEESLLIVGMGGLSALPLPSSGDTATDFLVEVTFGTGKTLMCESGEMLVESTGAVEVNEKTVTQGILSMISIGGGGNAMYTSFGSEGRNSLWFRP